MASGSQPFGPGSAELKPGMLLDGKYEIVGLLGVGGMGEVYKALHVHLNAFRCVKVVRPALFADDTYRARFLREARVATQIHHRNVAVVHDFSVLDNGMTYMVTEFIDGTTLRQWSAKHGRFPIPLAADVATQVLSGLEQIHKRDLLHRDISSDNVMLAYDADDHLVAKIIDLGVAKEVTGSGGDQTQAGMLIGNPKYMSPEQLGELEDGEQVDRRADLYCLGVVLYEMLAGVPPFVAKTPNGYIMKHLTQPPPPLAQTVPSEQWPAALEATLKRALEKDRRNRFADAAEFARALSPFMARRTNAFTRAELQRLSQVSEQTVAVELPQDLAPTKTMSEEESFQAAWEDGSSQAWAEFLDRYPNSQHASRAHDLLAEAASFESADTLTQLREFLRLFPSSRHQLEAEIRLVALKEKAAEPAWQQALAAGTWEAVRDFMIKFPGWHLEEVQRVETERRLFEEAQRADTAAAWNDYLRIRPDDASAAARFEAARRREEEEVAWENARHVATTGAYMRYLEAYTDGRWAGEARQQLAELKSLLAITEPRDFDAAWEAGTTAAWDSYLEQHADSARAAEARHWRQEASEFELAKEMDTAVMWRAFLKAWPEGRHRLDAEVRLKK